MSTSPAFHVGDKVEYTERTGLFLVTGVHYKVAEMGGQPGFKEIMLVGLNGWWPASSFRLVSPPAPKVFTKGQRVRWCEGGVAIEHGPFQGIGLPLYLVRTTEGVFHIVPAADLTAIPEKRWVPAIGDYRWHSKEGTYESVKYRHSPDWTLERLES